MIIYILGEMAVRWRSEGKPRYPIAIGTLFFVVVNKLDTAFNFKIFLQWASES